MSQLTKEQFLELSQVDQEQFINDGGSIIRPETNLKEQSGLDAPTVASCIGVDRSLLSPVSPSSSNSDRVIHSPTFQTVPSSVYDGLMINDPVELLFLVDERIVPVKSKEDDIVLHPWQIDFMIDFAAGGQTDKHPFQAVVRACNGSGKDKYIIAACAVWLCMRYKKTTCPVTSSSGFQLDNQTCKHIKALAEACNRKFGMELWDCKYRNYTMRFEAQSDEFNSVINCYATDEPGKAEGFHPTDAGAKMGIFSSECKTIPDEINMAHNKCTGYTHRVQASTPGAPKGFFWSNCNVAINRKAINSVLDTNPIDWIQYHIKASDCPHLVGNYIEQMKRDIPGGENSSAFRSQVDAEFGTEDGEMNVIPYTYIWQAMNNKCEHRSVQFNTGGLDLSDGVAETALTVRNGNKHLKTIPFKFDNTEDTIAYLNQLFKEWNLDSEHAFIYADCIGIGKPMLDRMVRQGWKNIRYVDNRAKALRPLTYKNRGSELWFNLRKHLENRELILQQDNMLSKQLGDRHYKLVGGAIHQLLSKEEERSKGHQSPDRADSLTLAFWDYKSPFKSPMDDQVPYKYEEEKLQIVGVYDHRVAVNDKTKKWIPNDGIKNFSSLKTEIAEYNSRIVNKQ